MMTMNKDMNIAAPTLLPVSLKQAVTLWLLAIGAGVFETLLVVANVLWGDGNLANGESLHLPARERCGTAKLGGIRRSLPGRPLTSTSKSKPQAAMR